MMNNNCDLEEVKHVALQKFLELAKDPSKWKHVGYYHHSGMHYEFSLGKFGAYISNSDYGSQYGVRLSDQSLFSKHEPKAPVRNDLRAAPWKVYTEEDDKAYAVRVEGYKAQVEELRSDPAIVAILAIREHWEQIKCEQQRAKILKDAQETCLKIQEALKEPTEPEEYVSMWDKVQQKETLWEKIKLFLGF